MKSKGLIAVGAILLMVIAVGCSSNKTTAPANTNGLTLSSDANNNRFDTTDPTIPVVMDLKPTWITLRGTYLTDGSCVCLQLSKEQYLELDVNTNVPGGIPSGSMVQVIGRYGTTPGSRCQLSQVFRVASIQIMGSDHTEPVIDQGGNK